MFWKLPGARQDQPDRHRPRRGPTRGASGVAIALIVKDEARHIAEWAAFHHRAGVRHFLIYDNGGTDGTIERPARARCPETARTIVPWRQVLTDAWLGREIHNQVLAYAHAASNFGGAFRWMAFIDADEFLVPKRAESIPGALAASRRGAQPVAALAHVRPLGPCRAAARAGCSGTTCAAPPTR